ncbi:MAG: VCBS repeat-containing protein, partial [Bacteroidetes bacterium]|nr:VCBS repeat-containing protein [Bacteroidota bacterium]
MDHKFQSFVAWLLSLVMVIFILSSCNTRGNEEADGDSSDSQSGSGLYLFEPVSDEHSGIKFVNFIWENEAINFFSYPYMYHGGGVAIGDINNDGLADIYFSGNMVPNKLYLNKGNLVFEDITDSAGVAAPEGWSSGVTMNDVNNDGYLDIYVCRTFSIQNSIIRENLLFINNGDLTFTERGAEYGINDINFSTHATFFDYDNDGDNDLYVVNHPVRFEILDQKRFDDALDPDEIDRDRLYRNNGDGTFTDVGKEAGVNQYGFGLRVTIS